MKQQFIWYNWILFSLVLVIVGYVTQGLEGLKIASLISGMYFIGANIIVYFNKKEELI